MAITTTYTNWKTGDIINICGSITEFCGTTIQAIYAYDINVTQSPNACSLQFGTQGNCGLHLNNVELTFKLVEFAGSTQSKTCTPQQSYKTLGSIRTNSNGIASLQYTVTDQDRLDYGNTSGSGYQYVVMACITNPDGQTTLSSQTSIVTNSITIASTSTTATHYIEYDLSLLPQQFLDLVGTYTTYISDDIGKYILPRISSNIVYVQSTYQSTDKTFRVYLNATSAMSNTLDFNLNHRYSYNSLTGRIDILDLASTMDDVAKLIALVLIFLAVTRILQFIGPWGLAASAIIAVIGAVLIVYQIKNIITNDLTSGSLTGTCEGNVAAVKDYIDNYLDSACNTQYPTCVPNPPTCDTSAMRAYLACIGVARYAQCQHMNAQLSKCNQPTQNCDQYKTILQNRDTCLANNTCTPTEAKNDVVTNVVNKVKQQVDDGLKTLCNNTPGYKWDDATNTCVKTCNVPILGYCLDTPLLIGGLLIGGYIVYKVVKGMKGQRQ